MARPSKPLISREKAALEAIRAIEEVGLDAFSLNILATRMGVSAPSLYHHFRNKAELLEEVVRTILMSVRSRYSSADSYEERIVSICTATRRALLQHPQVASLFLQFFPRNVMLDAYEDAVRDSPYDRTFRLAVVEGTEKLTFGSALFAAAAKNRGIATLPAIDAAIHPAFAEAVGSNPFDDEQLFQETIRIFLAGLKSRQSPTTAPLDKNQSDN